MDVTKPYKSIRFGFMDVTKPYRVYKVWAMDGTDISQCDKMPRHFTA
jgi:hypothetical protein